MFNFDGLSEAQLEAAIMTNPQICIHETLPHPAIVVEGVPEGSHYDLMLHKPNCPKIDEAYLNHGLKEVRTARSLAALNLAVKKGLQIQVVQLEADVSLERSFYLVEHDDGTFSEIVDYRSIIMPSSNDKAIVTDHYFSQYRYCFDKPWAAYLLPADVEEGDRVFVWDVIQDYVETHMNHGGSLRQRQCIATWVGGELVISTVEPQVWIG